MIQWKNRSVERQADRLQKKATIINELGLHARSAAKIAEMARKANSAVRVARGDLVADATSVIDILTLACAAGTTLEFTIEDPEDCDILKALVDLVNDGFGE
jgi:phosphocarrier protein HPr